MYNTECEWNESETLLKRQNFREFNRSVWQRIKRLFHGAKIPAVCVGGAGQIKIKQHYKTIYRRYWQTFLSLFLAVHRFSVARLRYFLARKNALSWRCRLESRERERVCFCARTRYTRIKSIVDGSSWPLHWISIGLAEFSRPFLSVKETRCSGRDTNCKLCRARRENISARRRRRQKSLSRYSRTFN